MERMLETEEEEEEEKEVCMVCGLPEERLASFMEDAGLSGTGEASTPSWPTVFWCSSTRAMVFVVPRKSTLAR
ncbi:hypothetical protein CTA1_13311 [Colletotrichum tanaceti]|uniref:Uncharacterized protein n=1 Tax=Colletotrichum tanaceti TaxID=1306861 RepID=A0A4U6XKL1_9PEZI|nr:hypothetical protein CTA1_13311 [Colletotrichum tanaceti]